MASKATAGIERLINTYKLFDQADPTITTLADGGWLVTWSSDDQDGDFYGIFQQRFDAGGAAIGKETRVNTYFVDEQKYSSVAALADGGWIVTWQSWSQDGAGDGVYQQRYNADGDKVESETRVNTFTTGSQSHAQVTALIDGGWVVTWESSSQDGSGSGIYQQRFDAEGDAVDAENRVNTYTAFSQINASITALADGGWVVTYDSEFQDSSVGVCQQRYDSEGDAVGSETRVNTTTSDVQQRSFAAALADGGWIVTWESESPGNDGRVIYQQRYDSDGVAVDSETRVSTVTPDDQIHSAVTGLTDGGWVVAWMADGRDGDGFGIFQQRFDADGDPVGSETRVNVYTKNGQSVPQVTALDDGGWVVVWHSDSQDGNGFGIYQREFDRNGTAVYAGTAKADTLKGVAAVDAIKGFGGNDVLYGKAGADTLTGGKGIDKLYGEAGADRFVFATGDTGNKNAKADTIFDFKSKDHDVIDLSKWDADKTQDGDQDFTFISSQNFHGTAGELRFVKEKSDTWIMGDTNGDKKIDFVIHLDDAVKLKITDFDGLV